MKLLLQSDWQADNMTALITPKLQWKSEEIRNDGGDNLIFIQYVLQQTEFRVVINDYGHLCSVIWNSVCLFDGKLEECKQFCSDKVLNDFLKLCK